MLEEECRSHNRLRAYWEALKGAHVLPREADVNPDMLADIWDSCFLVSIDAVTQRVGYRYSYMGPDLLEAYGDDTSSYAIANRLLATDQAPMLHHFNEAVFSKKPVVDASEFVNSQYVPIRYRSCIVPLGTEVGEVTHLLGCMRWRMY